MIRLITIALLSLLILSTGNAEAHDSKTHSGDTYLIIASYNPDTKRMSDFINSFGESLLKNGDKSEVLIEDLGTKNFTLEAHTWKGQVAELLKKHEKSRIRAIVLLGQEAWAAFLQLAESDSLALIPFMEVPVFCAFTSENGITLPSEIQDKKWRPTWINMAEHATGKFRCGGFLNVYDVAANIKLIKDFYPNVTRIALLTDNTYGGASLIGLFRKEIANFPEIFPIYIDGRKVSGEQA